MCVSSRSCTVSHTRESTSHKMLFPILNCLWFSDWQIGVKGYSVKLSINQYTWKWTYDSIIRLLYAAWFTHPTSLLLLCRQTLVVFEVWRTGNCFAATMEVSYIIDKWDGSIVSGCSPMSAFAMLCMVCAPLRGLLQLRVRANVYVNPCGCVIQLLKNIQTRKWYLRNKCYSYLALCQ